MQPPSWMQHVRTKWCEAFNFWGIYSVNVLETSTKVKRQEGRVKKGHGDKAISLTFQNKQELAVNLKENFLKYDLSNDGVLLCLGVFNILQKSTCRTHINVMNKKQILNSSCTYLTQQLNTSCKQIEYSFSEYRCLYILNIRELFQNNFLETETERDFQNDT